MGRYSDEFKANAKALAMKSSKSYESIAKEIGVNPSTFRNWMTEGPPEFLETDSSNTTINRKSIELMDDLNELKKELTIRDKEIKFLKKVVAYFSQNQSVI